MSNRFQTLKSRRFRIAVSSGVAGAFLLAACGSSAQPTPSSSGSAGSGASGGSSTSLLADAPVAPASAIPAGSPMATIKAQGYLTVGGTSTAPLFALKNPTTGQVDGFDADLARMLAKYIIGKPNVHRVQGTAATREALIENGTVNVTIATYTITPARAKLVAFAGPYYDSGDAILVKKSNTTISSVGELNGKSVCTELNSTAAEDLAKFAPKAKVTLLQTNDECLQGVQQGRFDAYVLDQAILLGDATENTDVKIVGKPFTQEPYGIGLRRGEPTFKAFINQWIEKIESDGEWAKAWKSTIGTVVPGAPPKPPAIGSVPGS